MTFSNYEKKLIWLLGFIVILGAVFFGGEFLGYSTIAIIMNRLPEYGLISMAILITLIVRGMNLSIVSMTTLSGVLGGLVMESLSRYGAFTVILGLVVMLLTGILAGVLNGFAVSYLEVAPILATLGTMLFYQGIAMNITKGGAITSFDSLFTAIGTGSILKVPIPFIVFVLVTAVVHYLLEQHEYGSQLYRIGKNPHSAVYSGINLKKTVMLAYVIAGGVAGIAAILITARYNSIRVDYGASYLISGFVAVSLGGGDIRGGKGTVKGVVIALIILTLVVRILNLANLDASLIDGIMGLILLANLSLHHYLSKPVTGK